MPDLIVNLRDEKSSVFGYISWKRLENELKRSGEIRPDEAITQLAIDGEGVTFSVITLPSPTTKEGE
jgi:hypothetical protein